MTKAWDSIHRADKQIKGAVQCYHLAQNALEGLGVSDELCQEIGFVGFMFFFELLFSHVSLQFPSIFPSLTYSPSSASLSADYPRHSR